jgi:hypothetical protein
VKTVEQAGELIGITLPENAGTQIISQYANDTDFTIRVEEANFIHLKYVFTRFGLAFGLWPNWNKSLLFWVAQRAPPAWLDALGCLWIVDRYLSKMLGTPFGIRVNTSDIDAFMFQKIQQKLTYWSLVHLLLAICRIVIKSILLSMLWFFVCVWGGR